MEFADIVNWGTVGKIVVAVTGCTTITAILSPVAKFFGVQISDWLSVKRRMKADKNLESYKGNIEHRVYVSKIQFDTEYVIYKELSKSFYDMVNILNLCAPIIYHDLYQQQIFRQRQESYIVESMKKRDTATDILYANAPFIDANIFESFSVLLRQCNDQINEIMTNKKENIMIEIYDTLKLLRQNIRKYLQSLEIIKEGVDNDQAQI